MCSFIPSKGGLCYGRAGKTPAVGCGSRGRTLPPRTRIYTCTSVRWDCLTLATFKQLGNLPYADE